MYKEFLLLKKFNRFNFFPKISDKFYLKDNFCIVEEFLGDISLQKIITREIKIKYDIKMIFKEMLDKIVKIHKLGYIFCDISRYNIIIRSNIEIFFIDIEAIVKKEEIKKKDIIMGTPGFFTDKFNDENKDLFSFISLIYFFKFYIEYNEYLKEKDLFKLREIMKEKVNIEKILQMKKDEFFSLTYKKKINYLYKLISEI